MTTIKIPAAAVRVGDRVFYKGSEFTVTGVGRDGAMVWISDGATTSLRKRPGTKIEVAV